MYKGSENIFNKFQRNNKDELFYIKIFFSSKFFFFTQSKINFLFMNIF